MSGDSIRQLADAMGASGITPPVEIITDGNIHRFSSNGKRGDTAGWYICDEDGGVFGDWRLGFTESFRDNAGREFTQEEKATYRRKMADRRRVLDVERADRQCAARAKATEIWNRGFPAPADHPYLVAKGVESYGLKVSRGNLVVPLRTGGELHSLQFISADGQKRFLADGRVAGCYHSIGNPGPVICIAEGYATAATIHQATEYPVVIAFNAGNLLPVARTMRSKFPIAKVILCADDDIATTGNPGVIKATQAAASIGGVVAMPRFPEPRDESCTDFNDMLRVMGSPEVRKIVEEAHAGVRVTSGSSSRKLPSFEQILERIGRYRLVADRQAVADCPLCIEDEEMGSLTVTENEDAVETNCSNGCNQSEILERLRGDHG